MVSLYKDRRLREIDLKYDVGGYDVQWIVTQQNASAGGEWLIPAG